MTVKVLLACPNCGCTNFSQVNEEEFECTKCEEWITTDDMVSTVVENKTTEITEEGVTVDKTTTVEIDSELFFNEISMDCTSWSFDKADIEEYPEVVKYLEEHEAEALEALRNGEITYLTVWRDTFF